VRVLVCTLALLALPAAVSAGPVHNFRGQRDIYVQSGPPILQMPGAFTYERAAHRDDGQTFGWRNGQTVEQPRSSGISFGPLHAESETINGKRRVHYSVDGLTLMGGQIGASLSTKRAILTLHWSSVGD
jgi:hypothetical protein